MSTHFNVKIKKLLQLSDIIEYSCALNDW